jgi:hypothetical protein
MTDALVCKKAAICVNMLGGALCEALVGAVFVVDVVPAVGAGPAVEVVVVVEVFPGAGVVPVAGGVLAA